MINFATKLKETLLKNLFMMENNKELKRYKIATYSLSVACLILIGIIVFSSLKVQTIVVEKDKAQLLSTELQSELDSLVINHERIKQEYGAVASKLTEKDSIIQANAEEIRKLIARQADYNKIKRKLELLRNISQEYVLRIDSISRVNQELVTENKKIKEDVNKYKQNATQFEQETVTLKEKINTAARLKAYGVSAKAYDLKSNGTKEEQTDRSRKTERIKVSFTLSENPVAEPGNKNIYCRIARPDGKVLYIGDGDAYSFDAEGQKLQYSIKQQVNYDKKSMNVTLIWNVLDKKSEITPGKYYAMIYIDGYQIGEASFELK